MTDKRQITSADIYYLAIAIYVLAHNIHLSYAYTQWAASRSIILTVIKGLRYISYGLCILRMFCLRRVNQAYIWIGALLLCGSVVATATGTANSPIFYFLFFMAGIHIDFKRIVKVFFAIQATTFILYVVCGLTGIIGGETIVQTGRTRAFLGYGWVNRAAYCLLFMTFEYLYIVDFKLRILPAVLISAANLFVYIKTVTFFPFAITFAVIILGLLYNYSWRRKRHSRILKALFKGKTLSFYYIVTIVIGAILPLIYNPGNALWYALNKAVTGRLALAQRAIQKYGLHIWGNKIEWVGSSTLLFGLSQSKEYNYVDAGFLNLALEFGILFVGIIACIYFKSIVTAKSKHDDAMLLCLYVLFALFIFEPYVIDFAFNPFPLYYISTLGYLRIGLKKRESIENYSCRPNGLEKDL